MLSSVQFHSVQQNLRDLFLLPSEFRQTTTEEKTPIISEYYGYDDDDDGNGLYDNPHTKRTFIPLPARTKQQRPNRILAATPRERTIHVRWP